jgi:hypothetical protein
MAQTPFPVSRLLSFAIPSDHFRMLLAILLPVAGVPLPPFLGALQAYLSVHRIVGDLLSMVILAPLPLTSRIATDSLLGPVLRRLKCLLTVTAEPFSHDSFVSQAVLHQTRLARGKGFRNLCRVLTASPLRGAWRHNRRKCGCLKPALTSVPRAAELLHTNGTQSCPTMPSRTGNIPFTFHMPVSG